MRRFFSCASLFLMFLSFPTFVRAEDIVFCHYPAGENRYTERVFRGDHSSYGYHPRSFSNDRMTRYSSTPEEQGHYILGESSENYSYYRPTVTYIKEAQALDPTRVLVSAPPRQVFIEDASPAKPEPRSDRQPRTNDSLDLQQVIEEHKWNLLPQFLNS